MIYNLQNISYGYVPGKLILDEISMIIMENEITLLTGINGSGKTTFCRLLTGLISAYQGIISLENSDLKNYQPYQIAEKVLYLKQEGIQNIVAATPGEDLMIRQRKFVQKDNTTFEKAREEALKSVDLVHQKNIPTWEMSAGQVKRIGLATLSLFTSYYWILDEPYLGLDTNLIMKLKKQLSERKEQGYGAMIVNHLDISDDFQYDAHYHLKNGKLIKVC